MTNLFIYLHLLEIFIFKFLFYVYICYVQVEILHKLQLVQEICTNCNSYKLFVQVATCTDFLYKVDLYKLQHVQILDLCKLQLVQASYFSVEQCILMDLYFKIHKVHKFDLYK